jgi:hypothetical protein
MAISNLNPIRLISLGFKAPAPSMVRRVTVAPAVVESRDTRPVERTDTPSGAVGGSASPYPIEPMLLLHQERVKTFILIAEAASRALRALRARR